ncbi:MAG: hypothetical protein H0T76_23610 [Nannocystis sp.]|nr:hypothetical protein [Nannocystis sp.]MBA3549473.1 hypothetical protein [Nannocystis sp.]
MLLVSRLALALPFVFALTGGEGQALAASPSAAPGQRNLVARCERDGKIRQVYVRADRRELQTQGSVEPELSTKIQEYLNFGRRIDVVAYAPDCSGWTVVAGDRSFSRNIGATKDSDYFVEINRLVGQGRRIHAVAFNPEDWNTKRSFVIAYDRTFMTRGMPREFDTTVTALLGDTNKPLDALAFSDSGGLGWSVVSGSKHVTTPSFGRGDYVAALDALLADGRGVQSLSTIVGARSESPTWLIASRNGYAASMLASIAHIRYPEGQPWVADSHTFSTHNPTLLVFLHGITGSTKNEPGQKINTAQHVAHYWGLGFLRAALGGAIDGKLWLYHTDGAKEEVTRDEFLAWNAGKKERRGLLLSTVASDSLATVYNSVTGLVPWRDGSLPLGVQARDQVRQIYAHYMTHFGARNKTELVLIGHSAGGLIARTILAARPTATKGLFAEWTADDIQMARFLAARTRFAVTMATPHDGSPIPEFTIKGGPNQFNVPYCKKLMGNKSMDKVDSAVKKTLSYCEEVPLIGGLCGEVKDVWKDAGVGTLDRFCGAIPDAVRGLLSGDDPVLRDLTREGMKRHNAAELAPHRAVRADNSHVPIYTLGGRSPVRAGHRCWGSSGDCNGPIDASELLEDMTVASGKLGKVRAQLPMSVRERVEASALVVTAGLADATPPGFGFGKSDHSWFDAVARRGAPFSRYFAGKDGQRDYDGFVGIDSSLGYRVGTPFGHDSPLGKFYFDHTREYVVDGQRMRGSWYRLTSGPWDHDNHGIIMFTRANGEWLWKQLIDRDLAGPYVSSGERSGWVAPK